MSNVHLLRYTDEEAERRLLDLWDAIGLDNRGDAVWVAGSLLYGLRVYGAMSLLQNRLLFDAASTLRIRAAADSWWGFIQTHRLGHYPDMLDVLFRLSAPHQEQASLQVGIPASSTSSSLTVTSSFDNESFGMTHSAIGSFATEGLPNTDPLFESAASADEVGQGDRNAAGAHRAEANENCSIDSVGSVGSWDVHSTLTPISISDVAMAESDDTVGQLQYAVNMIGEEEDAPAPKEAA